jgi:hypothetical protein
MPFVELAKETGRQWQELAQDEKTLYQVQASTARNEHKAAQALYDKSDEHMQYEQYLEEWKATHPPHGSLDRQPTKRKQQKVEEAPNPAPDDSEVSTPATFGNALATASTSSNSVSPSSSDVSAGWSSSTVKPSNAENTDIWVPLLPSLSRTEFDNITSASQTETALPHLDWHTSPSLTAPMQLSVRESKTDVEEHHRQDIEESDDDLWIDEWAKSFDAWLAQSQQYLEF